MFIYLSFHRHVTCLHIFSIVNNTSMKMGTPVFESFLPVLLDMYLGAELLDCMVNLCLTFWGMCLESDLIPLENTVRYITILSPSPFILNSSPAQVVFPEIYPKPVHLPEPPQPPSWSHFSSFLSPGPLNSLVTGSLLLYTMLSHPFSSQQSMCPLEVTRQIDLCLPPS